MTGEQDPPGGDGRDLARRRQPFSSLAAVAWAQTQVDATAPEHKRLIARDQLIEACRRENIWAATFLAGMLTQACTGIPPHDPAWFLTGRIDVIVDGERDRYLSRVPRDPMLVPRREGAEFDEPGWRAARAAVGVGVWPERPTDPDTTRWGRLVPTADREWGTGQLRQLAADLLYDEPPADRTLGLLSFGLRSPAGAQFVLRRIGDEAWQRAGDQGLQFPARDAAAARAIITPALEAIGWARRRGALHLQQMLAASPVLSDAAEAVTREAFLGGAELAAQFASPAHFLATAQQDAGVPAAAAWMDPTALETGPAWAEMLVAGMRALVLPTSDLAA